MKKFLFLTFLVCAASLFAQESADNSGPWMVCDTGVTGLKNIAPKTVLKAAKAKKGEMYEKGFVYDDMQSIVALGSFDNAQVDVSPAKGERKNKEDQQNYPCYKITYIVKEKPVFDKIIYQGRKHLSKSSITEAMTLKIKDPYNETKLSTDMQAVKNKYAEKGYINAYVSYETKINEDYGTAEVTLVINEGERAKVDKVQILGAEGIIPSETLIKKTSNRPGKIYKPQNLQKDYINMTLYGRNKGFSEFDVKPPKVEMSEDKSKVSITYEVKEGVQAHYGKSTFDGNTVFTDAELKKNIFYREGNIYKQKSFDYTVRDMQEAYANKGYLKAQITPKRTVTDGVLDIDYIINEGRVFYVDHVDVTGNESTKTNVLAREITIKPGDLFDYSKIRRSQTKIMNLGFINDVQLDISPTAAPDKVDLGFNVVEGRPGMFTAGIAMSSMDGLYGEVSVSHLNLFGSAQRLNLRTQFGKNLLDYTVGWSTPWVFDRPVSFGVDAFNTRRYRPFENTLQAYTDKRIGGRVIVGPRFSEDIYQLSLAYTLQSIDIYDVDAQYANLIPKVKNLSSGFGVDFALDTRDNMWDPTTGWRNSAGVEVTGGPFMGDLDLWTLNLRSIFNHTVLNVGGNYPIVFVLSNKFASTKPYGRTKEVPVYEKYFIGGADTIRGYDNTGQVGPPDGSEVYFVSNWELRFPLAREGRRSIAQLAAFFDVGNAWNSVSDVKFSLGPDYDQFKAGVGVGLRFATPQLPIRIDWGYGLNHAAGESKTKFYFNMSNAF
ncbi:MAG: outer membrane protein assembly factor BamA [Elusimicrobium sp.]|jgi:outer membrane protein insertion porin family|nr:outer membrane protein assembly factor BamA [Elusimicrobium sp.]